MRSYVNPFLIKKNHSRIIRICMGLLPSLLICIMAVLGASTAAMARPIPGGDGSQVTPAQQCLEATLIFYDNNHKDPAHSATLVLEVTNKCSINVLLKEFEFYAYSTCPSTNSSPVAIINAPFPRQPILSPGGFVIVTDFHTTHCVVCDEALRPSGWPPFSMEVSLLDVIGTNADYNDGVSVYAAPHVHGSFSYSLSNGQSAGDEQRCLGIVP